MEFALSHSFSQFFYFSLFGFEMIEKTDDVAEGSKAGIFVFAEVGDMAEAGNAGLVKVDFSGRSFEGSDQVTTEEFFNHFRVEAGEFGGFLDVGE